MMTIIEQKQNLEDIFKTILVPLLVGICFIAWLIYLFKSPVIMFPSVLILFFIIYFISGYIFGGVLLSFAVSAAMFSIFFADTIYMQILLLCEIIWIILVFFTVEYHRNRYITSKKQSRVDNEVLNRDIALLQSAIDEDEKKSADFTQRMEIFQTFETIIASFEQTLSEKELLKLASELTIRFIGKGKWKIKRYSRRDIFAKYVKTTSRPLLITDTENDKRFAPNNYKKFSSIVVIPIEVDGRFWGVIKGVSIKENEKFTDSDLRLLSILTNILGTILNNTMLIEKVAALAITDSLTGLFTKTYFFERLKEEIERARVNKLSLIIAMIDIDHFKEVNDIHGHKAGDVLLRQIADILRKRFREIDILARYGGEEFVVLLSHIQMKEAFQKLEELRKFIEREKFFLPVESFNPIQIKKTISVGLVDLKNETGVEDIINKADSALYKAKKTGRNKTCIYETI
ncbi:MAG: sensor domain-containing diguanylate cyclase [Endomicrobiaceae bacterium]|jgi:diguanylate cyclase (GGDEF)-like protein|nr:sensor domain-containing diguanylate cyclase [Endomicrobiaceae bacterium]